MTNGVHKNLALVLSGGGARGAYQAGVIHYIRTQLPPKIAKHRSFDILCGSSVGAVNTCFLAATSHNLEYQGRMAYQLWNQLDQSNIYRRGIASMTTLASRTLSGIMSNLFSRALKRKKSTNPYSKMHFRGFLDTSPFPIFLSSMIPWKQITLNIQNGSTKALSITATNVHTGKMELFVDKHPSMIYTGRHPAHLGPIEVRHAVASAAIPILFPAIRIKGNYYCDGGLRLNTPVSPAIQLGADKVLVIGLHHISERAKQEESDAVNQFDIPPTLGELIGKVMKTMFVDRLDYDVIQLKRINQIIDTAEEIYGNDFVEKMNAHLPNSNQTGPLSQRGFRRLDIFSIFPSRDVREIFSECIEQTDFMKKGLSTFEKMLLKVLDVDIRHGLDFLTFLIFSPPYLQKLMELGFEDAKTHHNELEKFFED